MTKTDPKKIIAAVLILSSDLMKAGLVRVANMCSVRTRTVLTRDNRLRLRYVTSGCAGLVVVIGLYAAGAINPNKADQEQGVVLAAMEPAAGLEAGHLFALAGKAMKDGQDIIMSSHRDFSGQLRRNPQTIQAAAMINHDIEAEEVLAVAKGPRQIRLQVSKGETLAGVLQGAGISYDEASHVVKAVSKHVNPRQIRAGQALDLSLEPDDKGATLQFAKASFVIDPLRTLYIERNERGDIKSHLDEKQVKEVREARRVVIDGSLYGSADRAGLPDNITANAIRMFSYAVDFQRDVREGDTLDVLYDTYETDDGYVAKTGDIIYARMVLGGREYTLYRYEGKEGNSDYYTPEGKSIRKSTGLMKTPIAYGRMTSGFGARRHPVLGYTKMHKGIDFGAPTGTPIYAAANGTIEKASRFSSYGNYIKIKHTPKLSTAYAHLSRYATGIRPGVKVKQGQVIGYVGTTGRSTGPHLHYEILINGVQVNPASVKVAVDDTLKGNDLKKFREHIRRLGQEYAELVGERVKLASR
jgi:murein DD-endopeptidase MepM/ murein hydrolase activator NlpD